MHAEARERVRARDAKDAKSRPCHQTRYVLMHTTRAHARTHKHTNTQHTHTHTCETEGRGNTLERARGDVGAKMRRCAVSCRIHRKALCQPRCDRGVLVPVPVGNTVEQQPHQVQGSLTTQNAVHVQGQAIERSEYSRPFSVSWLRICLNIRLHRLFAVRKRNSGSRGHTVDTDLTHSDRAAQLTPRLVRSLAAHCAAARPH